MTDNELLIRAVRRRLDEQFDAAYGKGVTEAAHGLRHIWGTIVIPPTTTLGQLVMEIHGRKKRAVVEETLPAAFNELLSTITFEALTHEPPEEK